jgi:hypothetical protein
MLPAGRSRAEFVSPINGQSLPPSGPNSTKSAANGSDGLAQLPPN